MPELETPPLRAVIYARKSYKSQEGEESASIKSQVDNCKRRIKAEGWVLVEEPFEDDGISGYTGKERPGFDRLLRAMMSKDPDQRVDVVVYRSANRLTRNSMDGMAVMFAARKNKILLQPLDGSLTDLEDPMQEAMFGILTIFATLESRQKSATLKGSYSKVRRDGELRSSHRTYGWIHKPGEDDSNMRAHPEEAAWVRRASDYVVNNRKGKDGMESNIFRIMAFANNPLLVKRYPSLKPVKAETWTYTTVRNVLLRPANARYIQIPVQPKPRLTDAKGNEIEETEDERNKRRAAVHSYDQDPKARGTWDELVNEELYKAVRARLLRSVDKTPRGPKQKSLLGNIATCGACGEKVTTGTAHKRPYYRCQQVALGYKYPNRDRTVKHYSLPREGMDAAARHAVIVAYLEVPDNLLQTDEQARELAPMYAELEELEEQRKRVLNLYKMGAYDDAAEFERELADVRRKRDEVREEIDRAHSASARAFSMTDLKAGMYLPDGNTAQLTKPEYEAAVAELGKRFDALSPEEQRAQVRALLNVETASAEDGDPWIISHKIVTTLNEAPDRLVVVARLLSE